MKLLSIFCIVNLAFSVINKKISKLNVQISNKKESSKSSLILNNTQIDINNSLKPENSFQQYYHNYCKFMIYLCFSLIHILMEMVLLYKVGEIDENYLRK